MHDIILSKSFKDECAQMSENERIKALQKVYKLDHQYYFNDQDRLAISKLTDFEREDLMMQRMKKIKIQSDKIALLAEI
jgi:hypothetical protein